MFPVDTAVGIFSSFSLVNRVIAPGAGTPCFTPSRYLSARYAAAVSPILCMSSSVRIIPCSSAAAVKSWLSIQPLISLPDKNIFSPSEPQFNGIPRTFWRAYSSEGKWELPPKIRVPSMSNRIASGVLSEWSVNGLAIRVSSAAAIDRLNRPTTPKIQHTVN